MSHLLQRIPLALKAVILGLGIGLMVWGLLNRWQEQQLHQAFMEQLNEELSLHAEHDRQRFDESIQELRQVARLIAERPAITARLTQPDRSPPESQLDRYHRPAWLPDASTLRSFFHARYALLLDANGGLLDLYQHIPGEISSLPEQLLKPEQLLRMLSHNQAYMTMLGNTPYVIAAEEVVIKGDLIGSLMVASPLDSEFLTGTGHRRTGVTVTALIDPANEQVIASSDIITIPPGSHISELEGPFLMLGKSFFDYGASNLELQFTSFIATDRAEQLAVELLEVSTRQRGLLLFTQITLFSLLTLWYGRRIYLLRRRVLSFGDELNLGVNEQQRSGDEIHALERQFEQLAEAVQISQQRLRDEAEAERQQFALFPAKNPNPVLRISVRGKLLYANDASMGLLKSLGLEVGSQLVPELYDKLQQSLLQHSPEPLEFEASGRTYSFIPALNDGSDFIYLYGMDITERKRAEEEMRLAEAVTRHVLDGIMVTETDGTIRSVNDAFCRMIGYPRERLIGASPTLFKSHRHRGEFYVRMWRTLETQGSWEGEIWNRRGNGELLPCYSRISAIHKPDGEVASYVAVYSDISEHKATEERLTRMAFHDALTGLPNRQLFHDRLQHALNLSDRDSRQVTVMFIDLDGFKGVNDTHGHETGDQLLQKVAERLLACVRESDTVSRLGGDEFAIILQDAGDDETLVQLAEKILSAMRLPFKLEGGEDDHGLLHGRIEAHISASIGIARHPRDGTDTEQLLRSADQAMYEAKREGKNAYRVTGRT